MGNKCDLIEKRQVNTEEATEFAENHKIQFLEISAENKTNIYDIFSMIRKISQNIPKYDMLNHKKDKNVESLQNEPFRVSEIDDDTYRDVKIPSPSMIQSSESKDVVNNLSVEFDKLKLLFTGKKTKTHTYTIYFSCLLSF